MESENKYARWMMTVNGTKKTNLISEQDLKIVLTELSTKWYFQKEKATSEHYQCCFTTKIRSRKLTILNKIKNLLNNPLEIDMFTLSPVAGSWEQAVAYCTKDDETKAGEVHSSEITYRAKDLQILYDKEKRYPWQREIIELLLTEDENGFKDPDDRKIIWVEDPEGCSGKSKLVKWFAVNYNNVCKLSFGTSSQMRSALISVGPKLCYFIDIPRTLGEDESHDCLLSVLEDLKNGYLVSVMYGKYQTMLFDPPHVVVFSNSKCPAAKMSKDRWIDETIYNKKFMKYGEHPAVQH